MSVTLCILFNHAHPANLPVLRKMYADRFDDLLFVMPFHRTGDADVVTSYRGSFSFQGFVADAAARLGSIGNDYIVFMQDDVLLNPSVRSDTCASTFGLGPGEAFLPHVFAVGGPLHGWQWTLRVLASLRSRHHLWGTGAKHALSHLPPAEVTRQKAERCGVEFLPLAHEGIERCRLPSLKGRAYAEQLVDDLFGYPERTRRGLPYPYIHGRADFFVLHRDLLEEVAHFCGVTAAIELFAEVALPTAVVATAERVTFAEDRGLVCEWTLGRHPGELDFSELRARFAGDLLLVHPVKLSQYRDEVEAFFAVEQC